MMITAEKYILQNIKIIFNAHFQYCFEQLKSILNLMTFIYLFIDWSNSKNPFAYHKA